MNPIIRIAHPIPRSFVLAAGAVTGLALPVLIELGRFALSSNLYSHTVAMPLVVAWLVAMHPSAIPPGPRCVSGTILAGAGSLALAAWAWMSRSAYPASHDPLAWAAAAWVVALSAVAFWFLGFGWMRARAGTLVLLAFTIPFPEVLESALEAFLQRGSAEAADLLFAASGLPYLRDGQIFRLPSITMEIEQECSGIHSSVVLFITSIVAGQMFLPAGWRRWVLTLAVIPLALIRNGFRVLTLGVLCERIGPHMIDHWIHHRGGPVFFALSLVPFFAMLVLLARVGRPGVSTPPRAHTTDGKSALP
ncbi:MAG: archaeosortase/exosortase family protein [Opitutaceae bacterium]|nr:archaeosortase/exosortase family protein [Opitutaceae bacterium]